MIKVIIGIIVYSLIAAAFVLGLYIAAIKLDETNQYETWPMMCGLLWPIAGPIAAAYIAATWFSDKHR